MDAASHDGEEQDLPATPGSQATHDRQVNQIPQATSLFEHTELVAGTRVFWRAADPPAGIDSPAPVLYVHGVPTNADDWTPFLERTGGVALDLPGFGRSEKSQGFDCSIVGYNAIIQAFLSHLGWERFSLVVHDWGGLALVTAQELHDRVERLVVINSVPLLPGYRWHRIARGWRTPVLGEMMMGLMTRSLARWFSKESRPSGEPWPEEMLESTWRHFDHGTQRAILRLYRSAPPAVLEQAGSRLAKLECPALVLWGEQDPYIPARFAADFAALLPGGKLELLPDAGHWPWIDRPDSVGTVASFLTQSSAPIPTDAEGARHTGR
ncbi:MAG: alpha/beta hydrolase [Actinobacteria bacterium]|nr:alpha/beta hydrolase [Actinomycetota bacterium]